MRFVITWSARCISSYTCKGPDAFDKTSSEISLIPAVNKDVEERKRARELSSLEAARVAEYAAFYTAIQSGTTSRSEEELLERAIVRVNMERLPVDRNVLSDNLEVMSPHKRVQYYELDIFQKFTHDGVVESVRNGMNLHNYFTNWAIPGSGKIKVMNAVLTTLHEEGDMSLVAFPRRNAPFVAVEQQNRGQPHAHALADLPIEDENGNPQVPDDDEESTPELMP